MKHFAKAPNEPSSPRDARLQLQPPRSRPSAPFRAPPLLFALTLPFAMCTNRLFRARYSSPLWAGILALTVFFADISIAGTLLPFYVDEVLHSEVRWVGIAITTQYAFATVGMFSTGLLADVIGLRRTVLLVSAANVVLLNIVGQAKSVGALVAIRACLGFCNPYALGLSWVATVAPRERLARWMAAAVAVANATILCSGAIAGALRGPQLWIAAAIASVLPAIVAVYLLGAREAETSAVPAAAAPAATDAAADDATAEAKEEKPPPPPKSKATTRGALAKVVRTRYFWACAWSPFVQGTYMGAMMQTLAPLVLKSLHNWPESDVARIFQLCGFGGLIAHASATPYFSSKMWRHRAVQGLSITNACLLIAYGLLGKTYSHAALVLPIIGFINTAVCLGIVNFMCALLARTIAPEALGSVTGLTRCLFTLGYASMPAAFVPMLTAGNLLAPCLIVATMFASKVVLLEWGARKLPEPTTEQSASKTVEVAPPEAERT